MKIEYKINLKRFTMTDVMLDIETYSTKPNACIMTIGAIKFKRKTELKKLEEMDTFYRRITLESNKELNRDINQDTMKWWAEQSEESRKELEIDEVRVSIKQALLEFKQWFGTAKYIWSHGDDFDTVIVNTAMQDCKIETPWNFWDTRDTRTLFDLAKIYNRDLPQNSKHHALHDCHRQLTGVFLAFKRLIV